MRKKSFISPDDSTPVVILKIVFGLLFVVPLLFLPAGTLNWLEGWLLLGILTVYAIGTSLYIRKNVPELIETRTQMEGMFEGKDKIFMVLISLLFFALFILPGIDAVRFGWSSVPIAIKAIGFVGSTLSFVFIFLVMKENATLFLTVKVEKNQKLITTGPYSIVRHPMYAASGLMIASIPFALGSYYSLIISVLLGIVGITRTHYEDKMVNREMKGYKEYAKKTRYRLVPGVW
jgi:protein-S-isoprenylcysteine O-methyltransferase Ste14